jgi:hypothetical protein
MGRRRPLESSWGAQVATSPRAELSIDGTGTSGDTGAHQWAGGRQGRARKRDNEGRDSRKD